MQFIVLLGIQTQLVRREVLTAELVRLEIQMVKELLAAGTVRQAWKRVDGHSVVLLLEALSEPECRAVLANLPFSTAGILDIQMVAPVEPYLEVYSDPAPG
jgi:muconolactone delta-isomerase